jgi:hypothetical protein
MVSSSSILDFNYSASTQLSPLHQAPHTREMHGVATSIIFAASGKLTDTCRCVSMSFFMLLNIQFSLDISRLPYRGGVCAVAAAEVLWNPSHPSQRTPRRPQATGTDPSQNKCFLSFTLHSFNTRYLLTYLAVRSKNAVDVWAKAATETVTSSAGCAYVVSTIFSRFRVTMPFAHHLSFSRFLNHSW